MRRLLAILVVVIFGPSLSSAAAANDGGSAYPSPTGGTTYGHVFKPVLIRPVVRSFVLTPRRVREGRMPIVRYRIDEEQTRNVRVRVAVVGLRGASSKLSVAQGLRRVGRTYRVRWGHGTKLRPGTYLVRLHVRDPKGRPLLRTALASGLSGLRVLAKPRPKPKPVVAPVAPAPVTPVAPVSPVTPVLPTTAAGVFPVAGPYSFGDGVGAARTGHTHQGQDILAAEGTPVVAPTAGTITFRDYQASAAGYYLVEHSVDGRDFFFAHCKADTFAVTIGAVVTDGRQLCRVGHTGDASGPHLHFEIWEGAWQQGGHFIDPLPQLRAWAAGR